MERIDQLLKMFHKFKVSIIHSYMYGGRISVIGGLRAIDVIVRWAVLIFAAFMSHDFKRAISYYLIGIHIGSGACSPLNHVYRELLVVLAFEYLLTGFKDSIRLLPGKQTKFGIGNGCSHFGNGKSVDKQRIFVQMKFTDTEILDTSESLYSIHGAFRYFTAAD